MSEEEKKALADLKKRLEERVEQLRSEAEILDEAILVIDEKLTGISFKRASEMVTPRVPQAATEVKEETMPLTYKGRTLGKIQSLGDTMMIEPDPSLELTTATRPFEAFFIRKIMEGMRESDTAAVANKTLRPDQILSYDLEVEGPFIRRIIIRNVGSRERFREIVNAAGWAFNTMVQNIERKSEAQPK